MDLDITLRTTCGRTLDLIGQHAAQTEPFLDAGGVVILFGSPARKRQYIREHAAKRISSLWGSRKTIVIEKGQAAAPTPLRLFGPNTRLLFHPNALPAQNFANSTPPPLSAASPLVEQQLDHQKPTAAAPIAFVSRPPRLSAGWFPPSTS